MEKCKISALDRDALKALFETNNHLQDMIMDEVWDDINYQFDDISKYFTHNKQQTYRIHDHYTSFYLTVDEADYTKFIDDLKDADADFDILAAPEKELLKRLQVKSDFFEDVYFGYVDISARRENNFYSWFRSGVEKLAATFEDYLHEIESAAQDEQWILETFLYRVDEGCLDYMETDGENIYYEVCKG